MFEPLSYSCIVRLTTEAVVSNYSADSRSMALPFCHIGVRTLENWEQEGAKPNAQAPVVINLVAALFRTARRYLKAFR